MRTGAGIVSGLESGSLEHPDAPALWTFVRGERLRTVLLGTSNEGNRTIYSCKFHIWTNCDDFRGFPTCV